MRSNRKKNILVEQNNLLLEWRLTQGLGTDEAGALSGVTSWSFTESGRQNVTIDTIVKLSASTGIPIGALAENIAGLRRRGRGV